MGATSGIAPLTAKRQQTISASGTSREAISKAHQNARNPDFFVWGLISLVADSETRQRQLNTLSQLFHEIPHLSLLPHLRMQFRHDLL